MFAVEILAKGSLSSESNSSESESYGTSLFCSSSPESDNSHSLSIGSGVTAAVTVGIFWTPWSVTCFVELFYRYWGHNFP